MEPPRVRWQVVEAEGVIRLKILCPWCGENHFHSPDAKGKLVYGSCCREKTGHWGVYVLEPDAEKVV